MKLVSIFTVLFIALVSCEKKPFICTEKSVACEIQKPFQIVQPLETLNKEIRDTVWYVRFSSTGEIVPIKNCEGALYLGETSTRVVLSGRGTSLSNFSSENMTLWYERDRKAKFRILLFGKEEISFSTPRFQAL